MMKLSLSARIAEQAHVKHTTAVSFVELAQVAAEVGYQALCIRPSQVTTETPNEQIQQMRQILDRYSLQASMACVRTSTAANAPDAGQPLRGFDRDIEIAHMLGAGLIRIGIKTDEDIVWAQRAADQARERGISLVHLTHTNSPFESIDGCLEMVARIDRPNFGLTVEPANLALCGQEYGPEAMMRLGPHILNVYVQNLRVDEGGDEAILTNRGIVRYERLTVGEQGGIDLDTFFRGLKSVHYEGFVTSHQPSVEGTTVRDLAQYVYDRLFEFVV